MTADWNFQHFQTSDVDELSMSLPGWTQRYTQLTRGQFQGALTLASGNGIQLCLEDTHGAILQEGETHGRSVGVAIPVRASGELYSFGARVTAGNEVIGFFAPRRLNLRTPDHFELLVIGVARESLAGFDRFHGLPCLSGLAGARLGRLPEWLRQDIVDTAWGMLGPQVDEGRLHRAQLTLLDHLVEGMSHFEALPMRGKSRVCSATVERALALVRAWMHERPEIPLNVASLCAELDTPRRTLQYCFEQSLGISPLQYLKCVRLSCARRSLKQGNERVLDVALRWGFDHPSGFARDYLAMFGEHPSRTLDRSRKGGAMCAAPVPAAAGVAA